MQADSGYDTTRFQALRRELGALNEKALADGLVAVRDGFVLGQKNLELAGRKATARNKPEAVKNPRPDRTPAAAADLLALLRRRDGDGSPDVPGTAFTEDGVIRLLRKLRGRSTRNGSGAWLRFLQRAERTLSLRVPFGLRTVRGVGLERLQAFARQLEDVEARGWTQFRESRTARQRKVVPVPTLLRGDAAAQTSQATPVQARRKGSGH